MFVKKTMIAYLPYTHSVVYDRTKKIEEGRFVSADLERSPRYGFHQDVKQYVWYDRTCVNKKKELHKL